MCKTILLTRPQHQATETALKLEAAGYRVIQTPLLKIIPCTGALPATAPQAVIITSSNALPAVQTALEQGLLHLSTPLFAVGAATAQQAARLGLTTIHCGHGKSDDLLPLITTHCQHGLGALLYLTGHAVAGQLTARLCALGFWVEQRVVYHAIAERTLPETTLTALATSSHLIALLYSPRSAALFAQACPNDMKNKVTLCCLSPAISAAASTGWRQTYDAAAPNEPSLLERLAQIAPACHEENSPNINEG